MKDYLEFITANHREADTYISDGWELIDTTKEMHGDGSQILVYHLGLPAKTMMIKYKEIIDSYERHGFKEQLFQKVAESNDRKLEDYERGHRESQDEVAKFMSNYEKVVNKQRMYFVHKDEKPKFDW